MININFDTLINNAKIIKNKANNAKMCCVVKCDAYGHGIERCARYLQDICDCFAVAYVAEANQIAHLNKDILLMLPQNFRDTVSATKNNYILTVDSFDTLDIIENVTKLTGQRARLHIKIDTGMHRLGFYENQLPTLCQRLANAKFSVEGVFSHFSSANSDKNFTNSQFSAFLRCANYIEQHFGKLTKHIANTSALFSDEKYTLDMVRVGLGLYGYGGEGLVPAKQVTARVVAVKNARAGDFVSYQNTFCCQNDTKIAIVDIGYAFGLSQMLSGNTQVYFDGKFAKVLGRICMGMIVIDASQMYISVGDFVEILGVNNNPLANFEQFSIYELLCNLK